MHRGSTSSKDTRLHSILPLVVGVKGQIRLPYPIYFTANILLRWMGQFWTPMVDGLAFGGGRKLWGPEVPEGEELHTDELEVSLFMISLLELFQVQSQWRITHVLYQGIIVHRVRTPWEMTTCCMTLVKTIIVSQNPFLSLYPNTNPTIMEIGSTFSSSSTISATAWEVWWVSIESCNRMKTKRKDHNQRITIMYFKMVHYGYFTRL